MRPVPSGPNSVPGHSAARRRQFHSAEAGCTDEKRALTPTGQCSTLEHHPRNVRPGVALDRPREGADQLLLRKEVIQPHLPVRLPCYDFVPIASPTFDGSLPKG